MATDLVDQVLGAPGASGGDVVDRVLGGGGDIVDNVLDGAHFDAPDLTVKLNPAGGTAGRDYLAPDSYLNVRQAGGAPEYFRQFQQHAALLPNLSKAGQYKLLDLYQRQAMQAAPTPQQMVSTPISPAGKAAFETTMNVANSAYGGLADKAANLYGVVAPGVGNQIEQNFNAAAPTPDTFGNKAVRGLVGGAAGIGMAAANPLAMAAEGATSGAGGARREVAQAREAGTPVTGGQEAAAALGNAAIGGASNYVGGRFMGEIAPTLAAPMKTILGRAATAVGADAAANAALTAGGQVAGNVVAQQTFDPNRETTAGAGEAAALGAVQSLPFAPLTVSRANAQNHVQTHAPFVASQLGADVPVLPQRPPGRAAYTADLLAGKATDKGAVWFHDPRPNAPDGMYDQNTNAVFLNAAKPDRALRWAGAHEVGHAARANAPEAAGAIDPAQGTRVNENYVADAAEKGNTRADDEQARLQQDRARATDEGVATTAEHALSSPGYQRELIAGDTLRNRVADTLGKIVAEVRGRSATRARLLEKNTGLVDDIVRYMQEGGQDRLNRTEEAQQPGINRRVDKGEDARMVAEENATVDRRLASERSVAADNEAVRGENAEVALRQGNRELADDLARRQSSLEGQRTADTLRAEDAADNQAFGDIRERNGIAASVDRAKGEPALPAQRRDEASDQLRNMVGMEHADDLARASTTAARAGRFRRDAANAAAVSVGNRVYQGTLEPKALVTHDQAAGMVNDLPAEHPARAALANYDALNTVKRGSPVHAVDVASLPDGARVRAGNATFTVNHSTGTIDGPHGSSEIPEQGMKLYGEVLPPAEQPARQQDQPAQDKGGNAENGRRHEVASAHHGGSVADEVAPFSIRPDKANDLDERGFYSPLRRAIAQKMPARASAEQIRGILAGGGVKADEVKHTGFDRWLDQQAGPVTKQQAMDFLDANRVKLGETVKGEPAELAAKRTGLNEWTVGNERSPFAVRIERLPNALFRIAQDPRGLRTYRTLGEATSTAVEYMRNSKHDVVDTTKYQQWTMPGGENYRERLMTLPAKSNELPDGYTVKQNPNPEGATRGAAWIVEGPSGIGPGRYASGRTREDAIAKFFATHDEDRYKSSHWDEPNVLAHIRHSDRTDAEGKRVLHVEEVQSDWHQAGREKGYRPEKESRLAMLDARRNELEKLGRDATPEQKREWAATMNEINDLGRGDPGVPGAPFSKTWHELAMKRMIRHAVEGNYDRIAWTPGEEQAARFDLSKQLSELHWTRNDDGTYDLDPITRGGHDELRDDPRFKGLTPSKMADVIGKETATRIVNGEGGKWKALYANGDIAGYFGSKEAAEAANVDGFYGGKGRVEQATETGMLAGDGLRTGGEGMKGFYDKILPDFMNKYAKRWGAKVGETRLPEETDIHADSGRAWMDDPENPGQQILGPEPVKGGRRLHSLDITPAMRDSVMNEGQPLFSLRSSPDDATGNFSVDPKPEELQKLLRQSSYGTLRGVIHNGNILWWDADKGTHDAFGREVLGKAPKHDDTLILYRSKEMEVPEAARSNPAVQKLIAAGFKPMGRRAETAYSIRPDRDNIAPMKEDLRKLIDEHENSDRMTFPDFVDQVGHVAAEHGNADLADAVEAYHKEVADDYALSGRGDMDQVEEAFMRAVRPLAGAEGAAKESGAAPSDFTKRVADLIARNQRGEITTEQLGKAVMQMNRGEEPKYSLRPAVDKAKEIARELRDATTADVIPKLFRAGVGPESTVAAKSADIAEPKARDLIARVLPEGYKDAATRTRLGDALVADQILSGYHGALNAGDDAGATAIANRRDPAKLEKTVRDAMADPVIGPALKRWGEIVNPEQNRLYAEMKRLDPGATVPTRGHLTGARMNLVDVNHLPAWMEHIADPEAAPMPQEGTGAASYRNPDVRRDKFDRSASYLGDYANDPEQVLKVMLAGREPQVAKLRLYDALVKKGRAVWGEPGSDNVPDQIGGQPAQRFPVEVPETDPDTGKTRLVNRNLYVQGNLVDELRGVLGTDRRITNPAVKTVAGGLNWIQMKGVGDFVFHGSNVTREVGRAQGDKSPLSDVVRKIPGLGSLAGFKRTWDMSREIAADTPQIRAEIARAAEQGVLRGYYKGGKFDLTGNILKQIDLAGRLQMNRYFDNLVERGAPDTKENRVRFVQQLGEYNRRLLGPVARTMRDLNLSPFVVAGKTMRRQGIRSLTGNPGFDAGTPQAKAQAWALGLSSTAFAMTLPAMINMGTTGTPGGRPGTPLGAIDTGTDNEDGTHRVIDVLGLTGARRGARSLGLDAVAEGIRQGHDANTIIGDAFTDITRSYLHPWLGPAPSFAFKTLTGRQLDVRGKMDAQQVPEGGAAQYVENARAALESQNPLIYNAIRPAIKAAGIDRTPDKPYLQGVGETLTQFAGAPSGVKNVGRGSTAAESLATSITRSKMGDGLTPEEDQRLSTRRDLLNALRYQGAKGRAKVEKAVESGEISEKEAAKLHQRAGISPLAWQVRQMSVDDAQRVFAKGTDEEKRELLPALHTKVNDSPVLAPEARREARQSLIDEARRLDPTSARQFAFEDRYADLRAKETDRQKATKMLREANRLMEAGKLGEARQRRQDAMDLRKQAAMTPTERAAYGRLKPIHDRIAKLTAAAKLGTVSQASAARATARALQAVA